MESIPPLNIQTQVPSVPDKPVEGIIRDIPEVLKAQIGTGVLVKISINTQGIFMDKLGGMLTLPGNTVSGEQIPVRLDITGVKLSLPMPENEAVLRLLPADNGTISFKVVTINNQNPEKFILPAPAEENTVARPEAPVIKTETGVRQLVFHPLDIKPAVAEKINASSWPTEIKNFILKGTDGVQIGLQAEKIDTATIPAPRTAGAETSVLDAVMQKVVTIWSEKQPQTLPADNLAMQLTNEFEAELSTLKNKIISGFVQNEKGINIIKTPLGNVLPERPLNLPEGTELSLIVKEILLPPAEKKTAPPLPELKTKEDFIRLLKPLQNVAKGELFSSLAEKLPAPDQKMLPNLVSFMKGALSRNLSDWLGTEAVRNLHEAGTEGTETAAKLTSVLSNSAREGIGWRIVEIPFLTGENISKIRVAVKKNEDDDEENNAKQPKMIGTRFVVDTSFSRLGDFQFDGFSVAKERRFDLIIRTGREVENDLYANLFRIFKNTLNDLHYSGSIKVNVKENFIKVCEDNFRTEILDNGLYI